MFAVSLLWIRMTLVLERAHLEEVAFETADDIYQIRSSQNTFGRVPFKLVTTSVCSPAGRFGDVKRVMLNNDSVLDGEAATVP